MHPTLSLAAALGLALLLGLAPQAAPAHEGHDHGDAPAATGPAAPRFAATSDLFELVGVLHGQQLALYLDHASDNRPVQGAQLTLEVGGNAVATTRVADGEFRATLAAPLAEGMVPVTATVVAGPESDLLAGELDIHAPVTAAAPHAGRAAFWRSPWAAGTALLALVALVWATRRARRSPAVAGGAV